MSNRTTAAILAETETIADAGFDLLSSCDFAELKGSALKGGMVLLDSELCCPVVFIDHFIGRASNGSRTFLGQDLDTGRYERMTVGANSTVKVAAR